MLCLGVIVAVHGLKGCVKVKSYFQSKLDFLSINIYINRDEHKVESFFYKKHDLIIIKLENINDCNTAQKLVRSELFIDRSVLPNISENEYYHADLIGMVVESKNETIGIVSDVKNFGASDILEIKLQDSQKKIMLPFTKEFCLQVDLQTKKILVIDEY